MFHSSQFLFNLPQMFAVERRGDLEKASPKGACGVMRRRRPSYAIILLNETRFHSMRGYDDDIKINRRKRN